MNLRGIPGYEATCDLLTAPVGDSNLSVLSVSAVIGATWLGSKLISLIGRSQTMAQYNVDVSMPQQILTRQQKGCGAANGIVYAIDWEMVGRSVPQEVQIKTGPIRALISMCNLYNVWSEHKYLGWVIFAAKLAVIGIGCYSLAKCENTTTKSNRNLSNKFARHVEDEDQCYYAGDSTERPPTRAEWQTLQRGVMPARMMRNEMRLNTAVYGPDLVDRRTENGPARRTNRTMIDFDELRNQPPTLLEVVVQRPLKGIIARIVSAFSMGTITLTRTKRKRTRVKMPYIVAVAREIKANFGFQADTPVNREKANREVRNKMAEHGCRPQHICAWAPFAVQLCFEYTNSEMAVNAYKAQSKRAMRQTTT